MNLIIWSPVRSTCPKETVFRPKSFPTCEGRFFTFWSFCQKSPHEDARLRGSPLLWFFWPSKTWLDIHEHKFDKNGGNLADLRIPGIEPRLPLCAQRLTQVQRVPWLPTSRHNLIKKSPKITKISFEHLITKILLEFEPKLTCTQWQPLLSLQEGEPWAKSCFPIQTHNLNGHLKSWHIPN